MNKSKTNTVKLSTYTFMMNEVARLTELNRRLNRKIQEQAREVMELLSITPNLREVPLRWMWRRNQPTLRRLGGRSALNRHPTHRRESSRRGSESFSRRRRKRRPGRPKRERDPSDRPGYHLHRRRMSRSESRRSPSLDRLHKWIMR